MSQMDRGKVGIKIGGKYEMSEMDRGKVGIKIGGKTKF